MRLKLDENIGQRGKMLLIQAGHDVATILDQQLTSAPDPIVAEVCRAEQRCLVTLDLDFSNPLLFHPSDYAGIAVLRLPKNRATHQDLLDAIETLIEAFKQGDIYGQLWIVQRGRIRIHQQRE